MPETTSAPAPAAPTATAEARKFHASIRHARISARKARYVTELLKGCNVNRAKQRLAFVEKRGARFVNKVIDSVLANVTHLQQEKDLDIDVNNLWIQRIWVDPGKVFKRFTAAPQGRAVPIRKRYCHIHVVVAEGGPQTAAPDRARRVQASREASASSEKRKE